jgi:trehalose 2-sulfotransferase
VEAPTRAYLICANARSGSTLLCRALSDTDLAGHPEEYFLDGPPDAFPPDWRFWEDGLYAQQHGGVASRREYLDLVYRIGSTPNGVFGAKLMFNNIEWVVRRFAEMDEFAALDRAAIFHAAFPDLHVVHLVRRDLVRQAVSWARMAQEGVWVVSDTEPANPTGDPEYDPVFIANLIRLLEEGERGWRQLYSELGVEPYELVYEDIITEEGYPAAIRGVLRHLGVNDSIAIPRPRTNRQADALNDDWVERFLSQV